MRKLTAEEREAKKAGQAPAEVVAEPAPKKKAKKSEPAEEKAEPAVPTGIGSDSFVFKKAEAAEEAAPAEETSEK